MFNKFKKKKDKKNDEVNKEMPKDIYSQLGKTGICILGETLRQGIKIIDNYNESTYSLEKMQLIARMLDDIFECNKVNYIDILYKLYEEKKDLEVKNDEYIILFISIINKQIGHENGIRFRWTEG